MDPNKPLGRQFARFLAEVSPKVEGLDPSLVLRADEASITDPEEQRPEEFRAIEAWVRVSDEPDHSMDGLRSGGAFSAHCSVRTAWMARSSLLAVDEGCAL